MVVHYTNAAEQDLSEIALYTMIEWSEEQFERYMKLLRATCEDIIPRKYKLARSVEKRPGILRWRCERHVIYFRRIAEGIEVVRVLHDRMLPTKHL